MKRGKSLFIQDLPRYHKLKFFAVYSSTAACAAANILAIMLVINYLRLDWSTFELHFSCILHVLHVDVSYYFVRIFIILQNIQFFLQEYPFT